MLKKKYKNADLTCTFQQDREVHADQCIMGVFSRQGNQFRFEEAARKSRPKRNPKLYDGQHISLVHMVNGRYKCHMRTIIASTDMQPKELAFQVYSELLDALKIIDDDSQSHE